MDSIYMFTFRHMTLLFAGVSLAIFAEGVILFFIPGKTTRWLERIPRLYLRLIGIAEVLFSLGLLFFILYR